jgi:hypothetical protein
MTYKQEAEIGIRSCPQCYGLSVPISTERSEILLSIWSIADAVLPSEIYLSQQGWHILIQKIRQTRELGSNLLEERRNTALTNVWKYQESLKRYYNKSVVQRELNIGDFVLKKDICTKDKHKFSLPWEGLFIIVDIVALEAYVLAEVDGGMLPNTWNIDQLCKYYA